MVRDKSTVTEYVWNNGLEFNENWESKWNEIANNDNLTISQKYDQLCQLSYDLMFSRISLPIPINSCQRIFPFCYMMKPSLEPIKKSQSLPQDENKTHLPLDVWLHIFCFLDTKSLFLASLVSKEWNQLISSFEDTVYKAMFLRQVASNAYMTNLRKSLTVMGDHPSWKKRYTTLRTLESKSFGFNSVRYPVLMDSNSHHISPVSNLFNVSSTPETPWFELDMVWPADSPSAYMVAFHDNRIFWVSSPDPNRNATGQDRSQIRMVSLDSDAVKTFIHMTHDDRPDTIGKIKLEREERVVGSHDHPVVLLLSNYQGKLVSFDEASQIRIWTVSTSSHDETPLTLLHQINADEKLEAICSMHLHGDRLVTAGINGLLLVWDMNTAQVICSVSIPEAQKPIFRVLRLINVAIRDDVFVYGLFTGDFYVHRIGDSSNPSGTRLYSFKVDKSIPLLETHGEKKHKGIVKAFGAHDGDLFDFLAQLAGQFGFHGNLDELIEVANGLGQRDDNRDDEDDDTDMVDEESDESSNQESDDEDSDDDTQPEPNQPPIPPQDLLDPERLFMQHVRHVPMTLAISDSYILTNGPSSETLAIWDLLTGKPVQLLSESDGMNTKYFSVPAYEGIKYAEITQSTGSIYASVMSHDEDYMLLMWDVERRSKYISKSISEKRLVFKLNLGEENEVVVWVGVRLSESLFSNAAAETPVSPMSLASTE